jgi:CBS domain-containing protein
MKAKDIMTTKLITVTSKTPILDAISLILGAGITGIPVVGDDMVPVGIITEMDLLKIMFSDIKKDKYVENFMNTAFITIDESDSIETICKFLIENKFKRAPVLSNGRLVGIISRKDLLRHIFKLKQ